MMIPIEGTDKTILIFDNGPEELKKMTEEQRSKIYRTLKELNDKVANGEQIMLRTYCDELGIPTEGYDDELLDFWGFDKKGFRQLYKKKVTMEIVPID